jgi:hypothetical protein
MKTYICKYCKQSFEREGTKKPTFCSIQCKANFQRESKGITKEWLYQKYVVEQLGTYEIAKIVKRDPKRVYEWLVGYGIATRNKKESISLMNKRDSTKLKRKESRQGTSLSEQTKNKISKTRTGKKYPNQAGEHNGMFGRTGEKSPQWKGGVTPERQSVYSSSEWAKVVLQVWKRDKACCQRCGEYVGANRENKDIQPHIHHIISFANKEKRFSLKNLVLLCNKCHWWVHSNKNTDSEFLGHE